MANLKDFTGPACLKIALSSSSVAENPTLPTAPDKFLSLDNRRGMKSKLVMPRYPVGLEDALKILVEGGLPDGAAMIAVLTADSVLLKLRRNSIPHLVNQLAADLGAVLAVSPRRRPY